MDGSTFNEPGHGTPEAFREFIAENLALAQIQAGLGATYAAIGDDTGLEYALRRLVGYTRAALGTMGDLRAEQSREARP